MTTPIFPMKYLRMEYTELSKKDGKVANPREVYWDSLSAIIEQLLSAGKQVYLLYPIPELPAHISKLATPFSIFNKEPLVNLQETTSHNTIWSVMPTFLRSLTHSLNMPT